MWLGEVQGDLLGNAGLRMGAKTSDGLNCGH
jgi:hypothetical protein